VVRVVGTWEQGGDQLSVGLFREAEGVTTDELEAETDRIAKAQDVTLALAIRSVA
jgi:hypothetical protein